LRYNSAGMPIATLFSRSRFRATWWTLFLSIVIIVLLELWRPLVFLTDDNLTAVLPLIMEVGRRLVSGDSPFINEYLFSSYNLQYDPSYLWMWNPLILLLALLANTGAYLWIVDLFCIINLLLCGLFFSCLLVKLREQQSLPLSEAQIILLSLSYTFSGYALVVGASWLIFLANQASLPIVMMGLIHKQARKGIFLVAGGVFYGFMVGHLSPFLFSALFLTVFIIMWSISEKSFQTIFRWFLGCCLALLIASPLLWPALQGFFSSSRQAPLSLTQTSLFAVPPILFIFSLFGGYMGAMTCAVLGWGQVFMVHAFPSCAASFLFFPAVNLKKLFSKRTAEIESKISSQENTLPNGQKSLERSAAIVALLIVLFVARPYWLGVVLSYLPLFRSLRWPFREIFNFLFFFHFWLALRSRMFTPKSFRWSACLGSLFFLTPLLTVAPFSFSPMETDRKLLFSGEAYRYWDEIKQQLKPGDQIVPVVDPKLMTTGSIYEIPYTLIGAYNYPALFRVQSITGYTAPGLSKSRPQNEQPYLWPGLYSPDVAQPMLRKYPNLKAIELVSLRPLKIQLVTATSRKTLTLPPSLANGLPKA
jgi:hypothetical protein